MTILAKIVITIGLKVILAVLMLPWVWVEGCE